MPTLYLVATPIGNLEDITFRAVRILREVSLIAAEDTRKTRRLLARYEIDTPLTSYHEHNKKLKTPKVLKAFAEGDIAIVSEAGMPGINDPGYALVEAALENNIKVVPIPGPSAIPTALAASGLTAEQFVYLGFLPRKAGQRRKLLESVANQPRSIVAFESPHRLPGAFKDIQAVMGERRLAVCREMTKLHEEIWRGTAAEAVEHFASPKGEFTLVIEGKPRKAESRSKSRSDDDIRLFPPQ
ncbi:MAG: 16S rRNA (cytidine(1402)-2'-O)-methyltransferase [Dehalococcoidia bacterium]